MWQAMQIKEGARYYAKTSATNIDVLQVYNPNYA
jgi:hypothetical protein